MEMMRGNEELLNSIIKNKEKLQLENGKLYQQAEELQQKVVESNKNISDYNDKVETYKELKRTEFKKAITNLFEITLTGLGIALLFNFLDNDVHTLAQALKSLETSATVIFATFGDVIILGNTYFELSEYKKENLKNYNINEKIAEGDIYYNELEKTRKNISNINKKINKFNSRIEEISKYNNFDQNRYENTNEYENNLEKPVQKKKI